MSKKAALMLKVVFLALCGAILLAVYFLRIPCPIQSRLGVPCPGCGMTRAYLCLLRLDIPGAFSANGAFWTLPFFVLLLLADGRPFPSERANRISVILLLSCVLIAYAVTLFKFFSPHFMSEIYVLGGRENVL